MNTPVWLQAPLFASLQASQRQKLESIAIRKTLAAEETLFMEGDPCTGFFVLERGAIQLTRFSDTPGAHPTLAVILPVNSFAEAAMFGGEAFPATATALKPSVAMLFPKDRFLHTMREDPEVSLAIIHAQAVWLRRLAQKMQQLTTSDSSERLQTWLRENLPIQGDLVLPMTKKALAAQLGMTPETLSRSLRNLQDEGRIRVQGTRIARTPHFR